MVDKKALIKDMVDKWPIKPLFAQEMADILLFMADKQEATTDDIICEFGFTATTAKRYMRQLIEYGYIIAYGGNRNCSYSIITHIFRQTLSASLRFGGFFTHCQLSLTDNVYLCNGLDNMPKQIIKHIELQRTAIS